MGVFCATSFWLSGGLFFWFGLLFFLPFGCGVRGLFFTNMLDWLVVVMGNGEVRELCFHF